MTKLLALSFATITLGANSASAQAADITKPPKLAAPAQLRPPKTSTAVLTNGAKLYVIELHEVPLVQVTLTVAAGGRLDEKIPGIASFTADMLDEGADTLDAFGIAAQSAYLGASLNTGADWDQTYVSLKVPTRTLKPALDLMAAVALRPTFRATDVAQQRDLRLAAILQQRDDAQAVARLAFNALVFPAGHPYHESLTGDSSSTVGLDSATVRDFYGRAFRPDNATIVVAGDITLAEAKRQIERAFGPWRATSEKTSTPPTVAEPPSRPTTIYLVDKPDAPQSTIVIGGPGADRLSPDYFALDVMNTLLGGSFSSRLMQNLRETKGYAYGASSRFQYRPLPGAFIAASAVRADVTDSALVEFFKEFRGIRDSVVPPVELQRGKAYLALGLPSNFETASQLADQLDVLLTFKLPLDYWTSYTPHVAAVTNADVQRVARKYIRPDTLTIVIVGDVAKMRPGIEALHLGPIVQTDLYGRPVTP